MTFQATVYRILILSPDDVTAERKIIRDVISSWNRTYFSRMKTLLYPVMLESLLAQEMSGHSNAESNLQIAKDCDILIGAFRTRIGTNTGFAESRTMEEIREFQKAGKPVMLYLSSVEVAPDSVNLGQYEELMKFMDDCLRLGLVERYGSLQEFREKLSRGMASRILKARITPKDEASIRSDETARKESIDRISRKFCDLVERYVPDWTREKNSKPTSYDDAKKILKDLTREILSLRDPLVKIFSKEMIKNIAEIIAKLNKLQKYRLYLDPESYRNFWKQGDEILASLDSIAEEVRKGMQGHTYSKDG